MPLPAEDVALVQQFVDGLNAAMPPRAASQLRYRLDTYRNALTIVECQAADPDDPTGTWFEVFVGRLRFTRSRGWELYYSDRDSNFHIYEPALPTRDVGELVSELDSDPTGIFFG
jgi:hypothetical protein